MIQKFDFNGLMIYEMANNHQGSMNHGLRIIKEISRISNSEKVRGAIKFQFRNLDTFIHPDYINSKEPKHILRFLGTRLSKKDFERLIKEVRKYNLITICTPFDEDSVDMIMDVDIDVIKVGSCSANDWSLLKKISETGKPVICSVGGLSIRNIDRLVSFFQHHGVHFALMYCVGIYPAPSENLQLNTINILKNRYPNTIIGYSGHENPSNFDVIKIAYSKGARLFERHVGIPTKEFKLNAYSSTPEQIKEWIWSYKKAIKICGFDRRIIDKKEKKSLKALTRGIYARKEIEKGEEIKKTDIFFAIPLKKGQLDASDWKEEYYGKLIADRDYKANEPLSKDVVTKLSPKIDIIYTTIHEVKGMLNNAKIPIGIDFFVELSHHYGIEKFRRFGATIIDCVNREYCKKLVIQVPNQVHPNHYHKKKEETFQILWGEAEIEIEGKKKIYYPGDTVLIQRGVWHSFGTKIGVIFEEISTTHSKDDSIYQDKVINKIPLEERKTKLDNWGVHQF